MHRLTRLIILANSVQRVFVYFFRSANSYSMSFHFYLFLRRSRTTIQKPKFHRNIRALHWLKKQPFSWKNLLPGRLFVVLDNEVLLAIDRYQDGLHQQEVDMERVVAVFLQAGKLFSHSHVLFSKKMGHSPALFLIFFPTGPICRKNFARISLWTAHLWCWKQPLY